MLLHIDILYDHTHRSASEHRFHGARGKDQHRTLGVVKIDPAHVLKAVRVSLDKPFAVLDIVHIILLIYVILCLIAFLSKQYGYYRVAHRESLRRKLQPSAFQPVIPFGNIFQSVRKRLVKLLGYTLCKP